MSVRYVVNEKTVTQEVSSKDAKGTVSWRESAGKPAGKVQQNLLPPSDLGLMPPGLRLFTQVGTLTQIVMECPPQISRLAYSRYDQGSGGGRYNSSGVKGHALVATPWRVIIARYNGAAMIGARMFYRPSPLYAVDNILYHTNLPNINCMGYGGTSVGWVCFYGRAADPTWPKRLATLLERCSGSEGYNNNMTSIDGPAFYARVGGDKWRYSISEWEKKTNAKKGGGIPLAMEDSDGAFPWEVVRVAGKDRQLEHSFAKSAEPLTLEMALTGVAPMHYSDAGHFPSPNSTAKVNDKELFGTIHQAFSAVR